MDQLTMMNIKIIENTQDKTFRFEIADGKKVILLKRGLPNKEACLLELKRTLNSIFTNDMINVSSTNGGFNFQAHNATSRVFKSLEQASDAIAFLKEEGWSKEGNFEVQFESKKSEVISKKRIGRMNEGYDFKQLSKTKKAGFELLDKEKERLFYFHLNDLAGKPMLFSRAYDGKRQRTKAAKGIVDDIKEKKTAIKIIPFRGNFIFLIKDKEGFEIAKSTTYKTKKAAEEGIKYLKKAAKEKAKIFKLPKKKKKPIKLPKQKFLLQQFAPKGNIGFETFRNKTNKAHYFHYHDKKGTALLMSPAFTSRKKRDAAVVDIIELSKTKDRYVMKKKGDKHYFVLVTKKGKTVAKSRYFDTERNMILGMKHFLNTASTYSEQKNTITAHQVEIIPLSVKPGKASKRKSEDQPSHSDPSKPKKNPTNKPVAAKKEIPNTNEVAKEKTRTPVKPQQQKKLNTPNKKVTPLKTKPSNKTSSQKRTTAHQQNNFAANKPPLKEVDSPRRSSTKVEQAKPSSSRQTSKAQSDIEQGVNNTNKWFLPLLILLAAAAYFLWRTCEGTPAEKSPAVVEEVLPQKNVKPVKEVPVKKLPTLLGPNGKDLGLIEGSLAAKIANFLSLPGSVFPETFLLDQVHFDTNNDELKREAYGQLDRVVKILKAYSSTQLQINGHTDTTGSPQKNLQLSSARAIKVKQYLVENGIAENRIVTKGFGASKPLASNQTESGKYSNRRSEIVLLRR